MTTTSRVPRATGRAPLSVRPVRRALDWDLTPQQVLRLLRSDTSPVALFGSWAGGSDVLASEPTRVRQSPLPLADVLDERWDVVDQPSGGGAGFAGGWIGYLGFALTEELLPAPPAPGPPRRLPGWWFGYYDHVLRRDRASGRWAFEALWTPGRSAALEDRFTELSRRADQVGQADDTERNDQHGRNDQHERNDQYEQGAGAPRAFSCGDFGLTPSAAGHRSAVAGTVELIRRGDMVQANICLRLEAEFSGDPLDAFCRASALLDPPYAAFLRVPGGAVASLSPELFLRRNGRTVLTRPIKGTARRSADPVQAAAEREVLLGSAKDRAENVMIVDLMRNDLSRVCVPGSVVVPRLLEAEAHPGLWHLVSEVRGTLGDTDIDIDIGGDIGDDADGDGGADIGGDGSLIAATFPPGSVTGAPKVRAVEIVHELETTPREVYTGAIGHRGPAAGLELNVAIRTFEFAAGRVWLGSGGGITVASDPGDELRECLVKASPLIAALGAAVNADALMATEPESTDSESTDSESTDSESTDSASTDSASTDAAPTDPAPPDATDGGPARPRPATGVFTSLRVTDGAACGLDAHLERLTASTQLLYGKQLPPAVADQVRRAVAERPSGRLRLTARPLGGPLQVSVEVLPLTATPRSVRLHPVTVPGGLGSEKWADRRLLAELTADLGPDEQVLVVDRNGDVLETDRATVFAVVGGVLHTPPADGRLLPGITRAAVLRAATALGMPAVQQSLPMAALHGADEVFVANSVHGIIGVSGIAEGGRPSDIPADWSPGPVTARLRAHLAARPAVPVTATRPPATLAPPRSTRLDTRVDTRLDSRRRSDSSRPTIVLVDNYDSFTHNLAHLLLASSCRVEVVRNDEVTAEDIAAFAPDGIVISPGPCSPAEAGISVATISRCGAGTPILGVCLGHQAIAVAYGGLVVRAPEPVHGRTSRIVHDGRGVLQGLPQQFPAARYHSLVVDDTALPPELVVSARTVGGIAMGLRHTRLPVEGVQFHPESILTAHGQQMIDAFRRAALREGATRGLALVG